MRPLLALKKAYGNLKIRSKLFLMILLSVSIPMLIVSLTLSTRLYHMIASDTLRTEQLATAQTAPYLRDTLRQVSSVSDQIYQAPFGEKIFTKSLSLPTEDALTGPEAAEFTRTCRSLLAATPVCAVRIYLDLPKTDPVFQTSKDTVFASTDSIHVSYWYGIFQGSHPQRLYCPPSYLTGMERENLGDCAYARPVTMHDRSGSSIRGYLVCYFHSSDLLDSLLLYQSQRESVSYITNDRDALIVSTDYTKSGIYYMDYESIRSNLMSTNGFLEKEVLGEEVYVSCYFLPEANWFLVTITPSSPLVSRSNRMLMNFILIWISAALLGILITMQISRSLTRRIHRISHQMNKVRNAPPVPVQSPEETDEIGELMDAYNYMAHQINLLIDDQRAASEELRIAEFNSLQAQINPHFLYNTMEMINWMAQQGRTRETNMAIRDLSQFYKLTLSRKDPISTIEEEIEHISIYTRLQNMRFDDGIEFVVDVPDQLLEYHIPRLTLQPVIENSILHGILEKDTRRGTIVLTGWLEDDTAVLLLSDDGVGIPAHILPKILTGKIESAGKGNHIAVYNTHRRLQLLYGEAYGLSYRSTPGNGTEVEIRFPAFTDDLPVHLHLKDLQALPQTAGKESQRPEETKKQRL